MPTDNALQAARASRDLACQTWLRLNALIGFKRIRRQDVSDEVRLRSRANRRCAFFTQLVLEIQAAEEVVAAPEPEEIQQAAALVQKVKDISLADAATSAGFDLFTRALDSANALNRNISMTKGEPPPAPSEDGGDGEAQPT